MVKSKRLVTSSILHVIFAVYELQKLMVCRNRSNALMIFTIQVSRLKRKTKEKRSVLHEGFVRCRVGLILNKANCECSTQTPLLVFFGCTLRLSSPVSTRDSRFVIIY